MYMGVGRDASVGATPAPQRTDAALPASGMRAKAVLRQGIRPDTLLLLGRFDHWATPFAKDIGMPSMNSPVPMTLALTDAIGSGADVVRVSLKRAGGAA